MTLSYRPCPLCCSQPSGIAFPYSVSFLNTTFNYLLCSDCRTVFVDPVPDDLCFSQMYAKSSYHDSHYSTPDLLPYNKAAILLSQFACHGSTVLDYGCGLGYFLRAIKSLGFVPHGVEYDALAANAAASIAQCTVSTIESLGRESSGHLFDVLHLGDVLEHLPFPFKTLSSLLTHVKVGGLLFVEGPLEINPSPVYWSARFFGFLKYRLRPSVTYYGVPTHLFRTTAAAQLKFFTNRFPNLQPLYWNIYETGWPYAQGNWLKRRIADAAVIIGGKNIAGVQFGNRFQGIFVVK
jgi:SAM-dependent methyltransferase